MSYKVCTPTTRICAMCMHWNGHRGGEEVKPRKGMIRFWEYNPNEGQICIQTHFVKKGSNSCNKWVPRNS